MSVQTQLQTLASNLVSNPGDSAAVVGSVTEISALMKPFSDPQTMDHAPLQIEALVNSIRSQLSRVHLLLESALAFHSGALLTTPPVAETYTPEGKWLTAAAGASLNIEA